MDPVFLTDSCFYCPPTGMEATSCKAQRDTGGKGEEGSAYPNTGCWNGSRIGCGYLSAPSHLIFWQGFTIQPRMIEYTILLFLPPPTPQSWYYRYIPRPLALQPVEISEIISSRFQFEEREGKRRCAASNKKPELNIQAVAQSSFCHTKARGTMLTKSRKIQTRKPILPHSWVWTTATLPSMSPEGGQRECRLNRETSKTPQEKEARIPWAAWLLCSINTVRDDIKRTWIQSESLCPAGLLVAQCDISRRHV